MVRTPANVRWLEIGARSVLLVGAAGYLFFPNPVLALLFGLLCPLGAAGAPLLALQVVVFSLPFYVFEKAAPSLPFSPTEFLLLSALAGWLLRLAWRWSKLGERPGFKLDRADWPILLFVLGALLATLAAESLGTHVRGLRTLVAEPIVFYFLARDQVQDEDSWFSLLTALALAGAAVGLYALYQYAFTSETILAEGIDRARGLYGSPNNLGLFLGRVVPIGLCLTLWGGGRRTLFALTLAPAALALGLTFSIGAWMGVAAAVLFIAVAARHYRLAVAMIAGLAIVVFASYALELERVTSHLSPEGSTWRFRGFVWQAGVAMVRDHPLLGIGLDNFLTLYERYMAPEAWPEPNLSHPHNLVLDFWLSTGLVGLVGAFWLFARLFKRSVAMWQRAGHTALGAAGLGLAAATVDAVVHGAFDNSYFLVDLALLFWLGQALIAVQQVTLGSAMIQRRDATT